jgi:tRNA nucleotidyltransferase (CCA-adding enzyme)
VRRWIKRVGPERIEDLYTLNEADLRGKGPIFGEADLAPLLALKAHVEKVLAEGAALSTRDLAIDGNTLMKDLGLKPGRIIGQVLEALLEVVITDPAQNEREALLARAKEIIRELSGQA